MVVLSDHFTNDEHSRSRISRDLHFAEAQHTSFGYAQYKKGQTFLDSYIH